MAEFVEIMEIKKRMDNYYEDCTAGCPLYLTNFCSLSEESLTAEDFKEAEKVMLEWAAEHHDPVYPSIAKYLEQFGIIIRRDGSLQADFFKAHEPMSADMAKLLGIEPKEGV